MATRAQRLLALATAAVLLTPEGLRAAEPLSDEDLLEFLGSVDEVEDEDFQEYLAEVDVKKVARAAHSKASAAAQPTSKSKSATPKSEEP